jgi:hypothetical protein
MALDEFPARNGDVQQGKDIGSPRVKGGDPLAEFLAQMPGAPMAVAESGLLAEGSRANS